MKVRKGGVIINIKTKTFSFRVPEEFHILIKLQATKEGKTIQEYIIEILQKDIEKKKEQK